MYKLSARMAAWLAIVALPFSAAAQGWHTEGVFVVSGGNFMEPGNYVKLRYLTLTNNNVGTLDSLEEGFTGFVAYHADTAWYSAGNSIVKYDLKNNQQLLSEEVSVGMSAAALHQGELWLGEWVFGQTLHWHHAGNLQRGGSVPGIERSVSGIAFAHGKAFVSIVGDWGDDTGQVAIVDIASKQAESVRTFGLDTAKEIGPIHHNGNIGTAVTATGYLLNIEMQNGNIGIVKPDFKPGRIVGVKGDSVFLVVDDTLLGIYNLSTRSLANGNLFNLNTIMPLGEAFLASAALDTINGDIYLAVSDYFSFGALHRISAEGEHLTQHAVGIAPDAVAVHYVQEPSSVAQAPERQIMRVYPNPASDFLLLDLPAPGLKAAVYTADGCLAATFTGQNRLQVSALPAGMYHLRAIDRDGNGWNATFIRQ